MCHAQAPHPPHAHASRLLPTCALKIADLGKTRDRCAFGTFSPLRGEKEERHRSCTQSYSFRSRFVAASVALPDPGLPAMRTWSPSAMPSGGLSMTRSSAVRPEPISTSRPRSRAIVIVLEHDAVVGADGRDAQSVLVEDQRARRHVDRGFAGSAARAAHWRRRRSSARRSRCRRRAASASCRTRRRPTAPRPRRSPGRSGPDIRAP